MTSTFTLLLISAAFPSVASAQNSPTDGSIQQIADVPADPVIQRDATPATADAPTQLGSASDSTPATAQLTDAARTRGAPTQVSAGDRDARPPQPLSHPSDGRTSTVERVAGHDRCDPAVEKKKPARSCANVIENRASEFAGKEPPKLSPEQRLLLDERLRETAADFESAAKRLALTGQSDKSLESLGVASMVLSTPAEPPKKDKPEEPAVNDATAAIINAIVNGGNSPPPE